MIRCIPQWLGPFAENLARATDQVDIELNSVMGNPTIDPEGGFRHNPYHAGNFQALAVVDAMDKVRHAMQGVGELTADHLPVGMSSYHRFLCQTGKMLFAQHNEMVNPLLNRGLPPDCAAGEPNLDYGLKSSDLACAAYVAGKTLVCM